MFNFEEQGGKNYRNIIIQEQGGSIFNSWENNDDKYGR